MNSMRLNAIRNVLELRDLPRTYFWRTARTVLAAAAAATALTVTAETTTTTPSTAFVGGGRNSPRKKTHDGMSLPHVGRSGFLRPPSIVTYCEASNVQLFENATSDGVSPSFHYERMPPPPRSLASSHAIFGHLLKPNLLERYNVYRRVYIDDDSNKPEEGHEEVVVVDLGFGMNLNGPEDIVHGGILALIIDDSMGFAFEAMGIRMAFTANLNIDYRQPVPAGVSAVLRIYHKETIGRKLYFEAKLTSPDGSVLYAEGSGLFILPKDQSQSDG